MGKVGRALPTPVLDGISTDARFGRYGENLNIPLLTPLHGVADEGSYYIATSTGTPGTGVNTLATPTTWVATSPYILIKNNDSVGGKRIYFHYIKLVCTVAGGSGTNIHYDVYTDTINRYSSGTGAFGPAVNVNTDSSNISVTQCYAGPLVTAAASASVRRLGNGVFKTGIVVVGDTYILSFGSDNFSMGTAVATINNVFFNHPPVILAPQSSMLFYLWLPGQAGASAFEIEVGFWER